MHSFTRSPITIRQQLLNMFLLSHMPSRYFRRFRLLCLLLRSCSRYLKKISKRSRLLLLLRLLVALLLLCVRLCVRCMWFCTPFIRSRTLSDIIRLRNLCSQLSKATTCAVQQLFLSSRLSRSLGPVGRPTGLSFQETLRSLGS